jgi:hypothetical protein
MKSESKVLMLRLQEVFDPEFVRQVLDRKDIGDSSPQAKLLRSLTSATLARKRILTTFAEIGTSPRLSDLASHTPQELKRMAKLGSKTLRWTEDYLSLLGIVLPETKSVHGMSSTAREVLASLENS